MAYEQKSIVETIQNIKKRKMCLPPIQRKFVWTEKKIVKLMDSIMRGYPIGTFLYWKIDGKFINDKEYKLYEFIHDYSEYDGFVNRCIPAPYGDKDEILAVLDGQQRLTSLYIALQGSLALYKGGKGKSKSLRDNYVEKELYFNVKSGKSAPDGDDANSLESNHGDAYEDTADGGGVEEEKCQFEFKFLTETEAKTNTNPSSQWFKVKEAFTIADASMLPKEIEKRGWNKNDSTILSNLIKLITRFHSVADGINYFEAKDMTMDNVLDIFVRVNSGGVILSKTDLLFSTIVTGWENARDEIDGLCKNLNVNKAFAFGSDFVVRSCLYVLDNPFKLKVESLSGKVGEIKDKWERIKKAIGDTVELLKEIGFDNSSKFVSYNAIMPLVYWLYHHDKISDKDKMQMRKFFVCSQIKGIFNRAADSHLTLIRNTLKDNPTKFPIELLLQNKFSGVNLEFSEDDIANLFDMHQKGAMTFMLLTLLYPNLKYGETEFHQDHLHPFAGFEGQARVRKLKDAGVSDKTIEDWKNRRNCLANLQMLKGKENQSKNDTPLCEWLKDNNNKKDCQYLPECSAEDSDTFFAIENFDEFMEERQKLMQEALKKNLCE